MDKSKYFAFLSDGTAPLVVDIKRDTPVYDRIMGEMVGLRISPNELRFIQSIIFVAKEYRRSFYRLNDAYQNYGMVPFLRMMIDNIVTVQAYLLFDDKDKFCNYFFDGKPLNQLKIGDRSVSHTTIFNLTGDEELSALYTSCCRYLHPTPAAFEQSGKKLFSGFEGVVYRSKKEEREAILKKFKEIDRLLQDSLRKAIKYHEV